MSEMVLGSKRKTKVVEESDTRRRPGERRICLNARPGVAKHFRPLNPNMEFLALHRPPGTYKITNNSN